MSRRLGILCVVTFALGLTTTASAAERGFYFGVRGGATETDFEKAPLDAAVSAAYAARPISWRSEIDNSGPQYGAFAGYDFHRNVAIEAAYIELSSADYRFSGLMAITAAGSPVLRFAGGMDWESRGFTLSAIGRIPLSSRFEVHVRAGVYFADTSREVLLVQPRPKVSESSQELTYGLGLGYRLNETIGLSLDYSRYQDVGSEATEEASIDGAALSLAFHF